MLSLKKASYFNSFAHNFSTLMGKKQVQSTRFLGVTCFPNPIYAGLGCCPYFEDLQIL
jgi:hypothetical protein